MVPNPMSPEFARRARWWLLRARAHARRTVRQEPRVQRGDRRLSEPVFLLSSVRSGSTLLRVMLNSHSDIYAPHELHLNGLGAEIDIDYTADAMAELGLQSEQLQFLLWDAVLHHALVGTGKQILVEKTPYNALQWRKILRCWPDARFVFLIRHPGSIAQSWQRTRKSLPPAEIADQVRRYVEAVERARRTCPGVTVRYEDLAADPERELRRVCEFLGVGFEPAMLDYAAQDHGEFRHGRGDWSRKLKSGRVQRAKPSPDDDEVPEVLVPIARTWGYLD